VVDQPQYKSYSQPVKISPSSYDSVYGPPVQDEAEEEATIFKPSSGFYGPTSFSAVFQDNENDLGPRIGSPIDQGPSQGPAENDRAEEQMSARTSLGVKVLNQLPNQATCDRLFELYATKAFDKSFHKPTIIFCHSSLWSVFGQAFRQPRKSKDLRDIAHLLSRNTMSVFRDTDEADVWFASLSGTSLRWEMMGMIFCALGNVLLAIPDDDPFWATQSGRRTHRREFATEMKECVDECVKLSNQMDNINVLMVSLLFKRNILESQCTGDTSMFYYRGELKPG